MKKNLKYKFSFDMLGEALEPVLCFVRAKSYEEAMEITDGHKRFG